MLNPIGFITWWAIKMPKNIFITVKRLLTVINNQVSFTLNIRLLFTPLYGDYTIIGRLIGFCFRSVSIALGIILFSILSILNLVLPLLWLLLPLIIWEYSIKNLLVFVVLLAAEWVVTTINRPQVRVAHNKKSPAKSFRREALGYTKTKKPGAEIFKALSKNKKVTYFLLRAELLNTDFVSKCTKPTEIKEKSLIQNAFDIAQETGSKYVETEHVFLAVLQKIEKIETILSTYNSDLEMLKSTTNWIVEEREKLEEMYLWQEDYVMPPSGGIGRGLTGRVTPVLDSISEDYTKQVKIGYIKPLIGREKEVVEIAETLASDKANILLIGEPGSGKTSLVKGIAYEIISGTNKTALDNKRIVSINLGKLLSGTKTSGEVATKITVAMEEVKNSQDIILFVDETHELIKGSEETSNIYAVLEPYISSPHIQFIGATTNQSYRKYIEPLGSFARLFQVIEVTETTQKDTLDILKARANNLESKYKVLITYPALHATVKLSQKLIHERVLPDKAIEILTKTVSQNKKSTITADLVAKEVADYTHIPVETITTDEANKLLNIYSEMQKMVIGQNNALEQISEALKRARVGMRNEDKPIASFLFVGTTGVGKTQTAKALAKNYFGNKKAMIRIDMSEYQQLDSINRLLGSPDGSMRGYLTEQVRSQPFSLILLDEIEKAHQNILLTFLQVLDDGRLTDSTGTTVNFTNNIIIATSNVGTREIQNVFTKGGDFEQMREQAVSKVREKFAPEFLNRFNDIIVFHPLSRESVGKIALLLLEDVKNLARDKGIEVSFKPELIKKIVEKGFSPEWGARPLAREIENTVENYLANKILKGEIKSGDIITLGGEVYQ